MAKIRASCPTCGDVELTTDDVVVRVCADDNSGTYTFQCSVCSTNVVKPAEQHIVDLLAASGVKVVVWTLPAELNERPVGEPFTHDDLLDFHSMLHDDEALTFALETITRPA
ncbi:MAG: hypothetical protein GY708_00540 [Actinomycetia bacterium]|nr:hypothetical protein [Actinomycetes bacterium]MCP4959318.1 hypothetical protein [Actinomycetes bacterium]